MRLRIACTILALGLLASARMSGQSQTYYDAEFTCICLIDSIAADTIIQFWRFTYENNPGGFTKDVTFDLSGAYVVEGEIISCKDYYLGDNTEGSGTAGTLPIWTGANTLGNSSLTEASGVISSSFTGALKLPGGTDAEDPVWASGMLRYNTTVNGLQGYDGTAERFLPWAGADNWESGRIPYSDGDKLTTSGNFTYASTTGYLTLKGSSTVESTIINSSNSTSYSTIIGHNATGSSYSTAIGRNASATGNQATAIGQGATASSRGLAIGYGTTSSGFRSIAIGPENTTATGSQALAIGSGASCTAPYSGIAIGHGANSPNDSGIAIGRGSRVRDTNQFVAGAFLPQSGTVNGQGYIENVFFGSGVQRNDSVGPGLKYTINGSGAFGTNQSGGVLVLAGGKGTGNGTPGYLSFSIPTPGASGSALQSLTEKARLQRDSFFLYGYGSGNITGTPAKSISVTSAGKLIETAEKWGTISTSTDGSGDIVVAHGMGTTPTSVQVTVTGTTPYVVTVHTINATNFTVRFFDMAGVAVTSTAVTATWHAKT